MKTALFVNATEQEFTGYWNGKGRKYPPGASEYMPDYLARHFAKHLTNRELLRTDSNGNLIYKDGDKMTSPKKPEEAPLFTDLFNKFYIPDEMDDLGEVTDGLDSLIGAANKNRQERIARIEVKPEGIKPAPPLTHPREAKEQEDPNFKREKSEQSSDGVQVIVPPDFDQDDDENSFQGKPVE